MNKEKKLSKKGIVLTVILVSIFAVIIVVAITIGHYVGLINHIDDTENIDPENEFFDADPNASGEFMDPDSIEWDLGEAIGDEKLLNILLVGQDRRPGEGRQRSDVMILCSINTDNKKVSLISFMRDLYVRIPDYSDNRLNAAYAFGGFPLLKKALYTNFGVTVDGCFEADFDGFIKAIDAVGGVDVVLTAKEAAAIGIEYNGDSAVHLNGKKALDYARLRSIDSDFGRTDRQKKIILAVVSKLKNSGAKELKKLADEILPSLTTDMSTMQIYSLIAKAVPLMTSTQISTYTVPSAGTYKNAVIRGMQVLVPDLKKIRSLLKESYLPF